MTSALTLDVDYDYQRYVVQNDHCYTPLTSPNQQQQQQRNRQSDSPSQAASTPAGRTTGSSATGAVLQSSKQQQQQQSLKARRLPQPNPKYATKSVLAPRKGTAVDNVGKAAVAGVGVPPTPETDVPDDDPEEEEEADDDDDSDGAFVDDDQDEDFSVSESENDRDSDLDFSVNDRYEIRRRKNARKTVTTTSTPTRPYNRHSGVGSSKGAATAQSGHPPLNSSNSGSVKKTAVRPSPVVAIESKSVRPEKKSVPVISASKQNVVRGKIGTPATIVVQQQQQQQLQQQPQVTLQQLPQQKQPQLPTHPPHPKKEKEKQEEEALFSDMTALFSTPDIIKKVNAEKASSMLTSAVTPTTTTTTSIVVGPSKSQPAAPAPALPPPPPSLQHQQQLQQQSQPLLPNPFELELIDSIVKEELGASSTKGGGVNLDLLDDGLPEELLQHVAELVTNKNLQEVIDKQVLGVEDPMLNLTALLPETIKQPPTIIAAPPPALIAPPAERKDIDSPFVKLAQQRQLAKQSAAVAASITAPRKEPIKVVRSDGRVITLPPIEAPTTRGAKRRAQSSDGNSAAAKGAADPNASAMTLENAETGPASGKSSRKNSTAERRQSNASGASSRRQSTAASVAAESDMDDSNWNSEDDPDRLWCICKQPHNNRFMICCDKCEDWFHGKCVDISKGMGQQMEAAGIEWTCPNCLLHMKGAQQRAGAHACVVCKQPAKPNSIYCGDQCIVKHSQRAQVKQQQPQLDGPAATIASPSSQQQQQQQPENKKIGVLKNKNGRVIVYNSATGQYLSGDKAPLLHNLKRWLEENPDYDVVQPGSSLAQAFRAKHSQLHQLSKDMAQKRKSAEESAAASPEPAKIQAKLKLTATKQVIVVHPKSAQQIKVTQSGKATPMIVPPTPATPPATTPKPPKKPEPRVSAPRSAEPEPIRVMVRNTFKEHLMLRMKEVPSGGKKLTEAEVTQFSLDTEQEMFALFNRDTGQKYKAKYRSLMFNIRDRKNETLFQKICGRAIKPSRLVRMSPEELASQELAQWRENENKHQLEMIKKSEMDLLSCAKSYVLKSHKGEEVLETMREESKFESVDDVTMLGTGSGKAAGKDAISDETVEERSSHHHQHQHHHYLDKHKSVRDSSSSSSLSREHRDKKRDRSRGHESGGGSGTGSHHRHSTTTTTATTSSSSSSKHHKQKRSRERSKDRERERDKERSKHKTSGHHSGHHSTTPHKDSKDRKSSDRSKLDRTNSMKEESNHSSSPASTTSSSHHRAASGESSIKYKPITKKEAEESYDLIEKILQGTSPELVEKLHGLDKNKGSTEATVKSKEVAVVEDEAAFEEYNPESADPTVEPEERTRKPPPPPAVPMKKMPSFWSGSINMVEVAHFQLVAQTLSGEVDDMRKDIPHLLDIVGRINPDTVWDYLGKIRKSPNKEIVLIRFAPKSTAEEPTYETLFSYLDQRKRLGVIKTTSIHIKDFYILPLARSRQLPSVLLPMSAPGFYEGDAKPNLLIGIVVKIKLKRSSSSSGGGGSSSKVAKRSLVSGVHKDFTPPSSPKVTAATKLMPSLSKLSSVVSAPPNVERIGKYPKMD